MKPEEKIKVIETILKSTMSYRLGQYDFKIKDDCAIVWAKDREGKPEQTFFATDAIIATHPIAKGFVDYNEKEKRCELIIY